MDRNRKVVAIFGSASVQRGNKEYESAYELGKLLAEAGFDVCNGGYGGTMEASARGAKEGGGKTIGIITSFYANKPANEWIEEVHQTDTTVERLLCLIEAADAFVCLRGGTGTLLELAAVWELMNKHVVRVRPILALGEYWNPVIKTVRNELLLEGRSESPNFITVVRDPAECVKILTNKRIVR